MQFFLSFFPDSSFKELLDDPYADLKSFAESALSEQDSNDGEKVIDSRAIFDVYICRGCHYFFTIIGYFFHVEDNKFLNYFFFCREVELFIVVLEMLVKK